MIRIRRKAAFVLPMLLSAGCASMTPTENGVAGGGLLGAGTGAVVGHALGSTGAGALIGAGVGAISGGLVGNAVEKSEQRSAAQAAIARNRMAIGDVIQMVHNHVSDDLIVSQIRSSGTVFQLSGQDILTLKQNGVSDVVVQEMMATATRVPRRYYSADPVYGPVVYEGGYVVAPPPPPVTVGVGIGGYYGPRRY